MISEADMRITEVSHSKKHFLWLRGRVNLQAFLLATVVLVVYVQSGTFAYQSEDNIPNSLLPFSLLLHHSFFLGRYFSAATLSSAPYFLTPSHGDYVDYQPIGASLTALPIYAIYCLFGGTGSIGYGVIMGKLAASLIAATSVGLLYVIMRKLSIRTSLSIVFTVLYAFGSETFAISSQALWRHGPAEFWFALFLLATVRIVSRPDKSVTAAQFAGLAMGMLFLCRAQDFILVLPFVLLIFKREYRKAILLSLPWLLLSVAFHEWYKVTYFNQPVSVSSATGASRVGALNGGFLSGFLGTTISPDRGLLAFMPWTLFSFLWMFYVRRLKPWHLVYVLMGVGTVLYIFMYSKLSYWDAGGSYGGRYMTDALPAFAILAAAYFEAVLRPDKRRKKWADAIRYAFLSIFGLWSIGVQFLGADAPTGSNWNPAVNPDAFHSNMWLVRNGEIAYYVRALEASKQPPHIVHNPSVQFHQLSLQGIPMQSPIQLAPGQMYSGTLTVRNTGTDAWPAYVANNGKGYVQLLYSIWKNGEKVTIPEPRQQYTVLLHSVRPGESITIYMYIQAPTEPGRYTYVFTLGQNGYGQFGHGLNSKNTLQVPVLVSPN